jgi:hypothetical protein
MIDSTEVVCTLLGLVRRISATELELGSLLNTMKHDYASGTFQYKTVSSVYDRSRIFHTEAVRATCQLLQERDQEARRWHYEHEMPSCESRLRHLAAHECLTDFTSLLCELTEPIPWSSIRFPSLMPPSSPPSQNHTVANGRARAHARSHID